MPLLDLTGQRYGRLVVVPHTPRLIGSRYHCKVRCDCGVVKWTNSNNMRAGNTRSCGCLLKEVAGQHSKTHGLSSHPLYQIWGGMLTRAQNSKREKWHRYGGRGIKVCRRWKIFQNFYDDMLATYAPGLTIERKNNNLGYRPSNCKWLSREEQALNTSRVTFLLYKGKQVPLPLVARAERIHVETLRSRIKARGSRDFRKLK